MSSNVGPAALWVLVLACLAACATAHQAPVPIGVLPEVKIACRAREEVYRNSSERTVNVTIQATDACEGFGSEVILESEEEETKTEQVPDERTRAFTFSVKPGGILFFDCSGGSDAGGECRYTLSVP